MGSVAYVHFHAELDNKISYQGNLGFSMDYLQSLHNSVPGVAHLL